jgi:hypothetical protein
MTSLIRRNLYHGRGQNQSKLIPSAKGNEIMLANSDIGGSTQENPILVSQTRENLNSSAELNPRKTTCPTIDHPSVLSDEDLTSVLREISGFVSVENYEEVLVENYAIDGSLVTIPYPIVSDGRVYTYMAGKIGCDCSDIVISTRAGRVVGLDGFIDGQLVSPGVSLRCTLRIRGGKKKYTGGMIGNPAVIAAIEKNARKTLRKQKRRQERVSKRKNSRVQPSKDSLGMRTVQIYRAPANRVPKNESMGNLKLSPCALKYALALSSPWSPEARGACIPTTPSRDTQKVTGFQRFPAAVGVNGCWAILICPTTCNDKFCCLATNTTYTGTPSDTFAPFDDTGILKSEWNAYSIDNLPYNSGLYTNNDGANGLLMTSDNIAGRIVSASLEVTYNNSTLNEGGTTVCYCSPNHCDLSQESQTSITTYMESDVVGTTRKPCSIQGTPARPCELQFPDYTAEVTGLANPVADINTALVTSLVYPWSNGAMINTNLSTDASEVTVQGAAIMVACGSGTINSVPWVLAQYIVHVEYVGLPANAMLTPNTADPEGMEMVVAAANRIQSLKMEYPKKTIPQLMWEGLKEVSTALIPIGVAAIKAALLA